MRIIAIATLFCLAAMPIHAEEKYITVRKACVQTADTPECTNYRQESVTLKQGGEFSLQMGWDFSPKSPCSDQAKECAYYEFGKVFRVDLDGNRKLVYKWGGSLKDWFSSGGSVNQNIPESWFSGESQVLVKGSYLIVLLFSTGEDNSGDLLRLEFPISIQ